FQNAGSEYWTCSECSCAQSFYTCPEHPDVASLFEYDGSQSILDDEKLYLDEVLRAKAKAKERQRSRSLSPRRRGEIEENLRRRRSKSLSRSQEKLTQKRSLSRSLENLSKKTGYAEDDLESEASSKKRGPSIHPEGEARRKSRSRSTSLTKEIVSSFLEFRDKVLERSHSRSRSKSAERDSTTPSSEKLIDNIGASYKDVLHLEESLKPEISDESTDKEEDSEDFSKFIEQEIEKSIDDTQIKSEEKFPRKISPSYQISGYNESFIYSDLTDKEMPESDFQISGAGDSVKSKTTASPEGKRHTLDEIEKDSSKERELEDEEPVLKVKERVALIESQQLGVRDEGVDPDYQNLYKKKISPTESSTAASVPVFATKEEEETKEMKDDDSQNWRETSSERITTKVILHSDSKGDQRTLTLEHTKTHRQPSFEVSPPVEEMTSWSPFCITSSQPASATTSTTITTTTVSFPTTTNTFTTFTTFESSVTPVNNSSITPVVQNVLINQSKPLSITPSLMNATKIAKVLSEETLRLALQCASEFLAKSKEEEIKDLNQDRGIVYPSDFFFFDHNSRWDDSEETFVGEKLGTEIIIDEEDKDHVLTDFSDDAESPCIKIERETKLSAQLPDSVREMNEDIYDSQEDIILKEAFENNNDIKTEENIGESQDEPLPPRPPLPSGALKSLASIYARMTANDSFLKLRDDGYDELGSRSPLPPRPEPPSDESDTEEEAIYLGSSSFIRESPIDIPSEEKDIAPHLDYKYSESSYARRPLPTIIEMSSSSENSGESSGSLSPTEKSALSSELLKIFASTRLNQCASSTVNSNGKEPSKAPPASPTSPSKLNPLYHSTSLNNKDTKDLFDKNNISEDSDFDSNKFVIDRESTQEPLSFSAYDTTWEDSNLPDHSCLVETLTKSQEELRDELERPSVAIIEEEPLLNLLREVRKTDLIINKSI
ncbi:hypothetical protein Avbf_03674, partial [Armadillidium vulgare]